MIKHWLEAFRLRTLPLALSSIIMGGFLAVKANAFSWDIFGLSILTTVFLQVLSNLANDYGDSVHGADSGDRQGPQRAVQTGAISATAMKRAMVLFAGLSLVAGLALLYVAFADQLIYVSIFLGVGLLSIYAAITYTSGKNPYGYMGLGDISVFLFFGLVGVLGSYFLYTRSFDTWAVLPAISCGLFATGVLNVNNIRDIESDKKAGKRSIPVRIGWKRAVYYHWVLLLGGVLAALCFVLINYQSPVQFLWCGTIPLFVINARAVFFKTSATELDPYLKQLALSTLIFVVSFGIGMLF
ncbi:1,4-dihydroxy-2-naphthoate prenyltransferase [Reichenbachiella agariperforans]|uniref:1,4-dihydroxy-2-naphthoate octaprenyltransferase n=1 Tax=Reichenbachiella agariperforans TaxID=156994 RepID=A0A1M6M5P9_REIAG|nr:1,4-dihydroxy-2-naphthoate polyprenyltransferase [Reichenbachiella agariperforans]SHJ78795.1 1,4-dihydroxy-2-naphthoate prenyltransferase [Reichenbachiella agariperforans]